MSSIRLSLVASLASLVLVPLAACGSDTGDAPDASLQLLDAPPPPDAEPPPDAPACQLTECDGLCTDTDVDPLNCGVCGMECQGGAECSGGDCVCVVDYVPATPSFLFSQTNGTAVPGATAGFGIYSYAGVANLMLAAYPTDTVVIGQDYDLSMGTVGTPPLLGVSYDFDVQNQMPSNVIHYATAGTLVFDTICTDGFTGHATDVTFSGVTSLTNPTIDPNGCTFTVASVSFAFGAACQNQ
ncbi:MAG: hypothetical protein KC464_07750 [Myxococcales bacterium]|nr:hypothetical protein [Myxococcales bacterium]